jgi:CRP-like cAMP-binding protein
VTTTSVAYRPSETVFVQGDRSAAVMYLEKGRVNLTVRSGDGREAIVGVVHPGAFFGEGALAGQRLRRATATTMIASRVAVVKTSEMRRGLREQVGLSDRFRTYMLSRNARIEEDLVGQMFNRSEKRLAKMLLLLANFDEHSHVRSPLPIMSRNMLADALGTTRSKIDVLMNKFRKLGFLERRSERDGGVQVHRSMLSVVLQE